MKSISQRVALTLKEQRDSEEQRTQRDRTRRQSTPQGQAASEFVRKGGAGVTGGGDGAKYPLRRKPASQRTRMKAVGGGKMEPVKGYKTRKDAGKEKETSRLDITGKKSGQDTGGYKPKELPKQERGSANVPLHKQSKEQKRAAYLAKKAAQARGEKIGLSTSKGGGDRDVEKQADKALETGASRPKAEKKPVSPDYKPRKASGMTAKERVHQHRKGERALKDIMRGQERDKAAKKGEKPSKGEITKRVMKRWK